MRRMKRWGLCFLSLLFLLATQGVPANSQAPNSAVQNQPPFLVRMERLYDHEDVCVLVSGSGQYRLEQHFVTKDAVYLGSLSSAELHGLETILELPKLRRITAKDIHGSLLTDTLDEFVIGVFRREGTQNLHFPTPDSRKPFRGSLDPLLKWFKAVEKDKHTEIPASNASHCMPPQSNTHLIANSFLNDSPSLGSRGSDLLLRLVNSHFYRGTVDETCVIVRASGRYRIEKTNQTYNGGVNGSFREDSLGTDDLQALHELIDAPELVNYPEQSLPTGRPCAEGEVTTVSVGRKGKIQNLLLDSCFNALPVPNSPGGLDNLQYRVRENGKAIEALKKWIAKTLEKQKLVRAQASDLNRCRP